VTPAPVTDVWLRADPYERYMGRWSRRLAPLFLAWLAVPHGQRWLDVGCGTGALSQAIVDQAEPASLVGIDASHGFVCQARANLAGRAALHVAAADAIPLAAEQVNACVSALVLNFLPDLTGAMREMVRVTATDGTVAACVWDYAGRMDMIRAFWDVAAELDSAAVALDEGQKFARCRPDALRNAFVAAGLNEVRVTAIEIATPFTDFDDYWLPFLGGQGPAPSYVVSLDDRGRTLLREGLRAKLALQQRGPAGLVARAWAVRGTAKR
jgi:SAM-dependent methyltransferase